MKYIRHRVPLGNWEIGHERPEADDVAELLVSEGKAEFIERLGPPKDKKFHTLSDVVEQHRAMAAKADEEKLAGGTATKVIKKG